MPIQKTTPEEIIRHSIQVFRKNGYYRTNMNDLAREVGLTKGAFYHHFASKEEVMRKSLQATSAWFERKVFSITLDETLSDQEKLSKMGEVTFRAFTDYTGGCFFANTILETAHVEDTFLPEINHFFDQWGKALKRIFEEKYSGIALENLVQQIIADIEGSIILMQLYKDNTYLQRALERSIKLL